MILLAIPAIQPLSSVPIAPESIQTMRDWAWTFVAAVLQHSVRQETTVIRARTLPSCLYQREIQLGEPVSLERSDLEEQQENSGKQDEGEDGILEYDSLSDDGDIPSLQREADFHLWRGSRFGRSIRFNSRIEFS